MKCSVKIIDSHLPSTIKHHVHGLSDIIDQIPTIIFINAMD